MIGRHHPVASFLAPNYPFFFCHSYCNPSYFLGFWDRKTLFFTAVAILLTWITRILVACIPTCKVGRLDKITAVFNQMIFQLSNVFLFCMSFPVPSETPAGNYHIYSNNIFIFISAENIDMWNFNQGNTVINLSFLSSNFDRFFYFKIWTYLWRDKTQIIAKITYKIELFYLEKMLFLWQTRFTVVNSAAVNNEQQLKPDSNFIIIAAHS